MSAAGWVKLHRVLADHDLWLGEPFTRAQAWVDLLLLANHKVGHIRRRGIKIPVRRGQVGYSQEALADRWKWSKGKVIRFLAELKADERITQEIVLKNLAVSSLICITNYDEYQCGSTEDGTEAGTKNRPKAVPKTVPEQESKEGKELDMSKRFTVPTEEDVQAYMEEIGYDGNAQHFVDFYASKGWMVGKNKMKDWKAAVRTWHRNDATRIKRALGCTPQERRKTKEEVMELL
ncbi:hypothetical protein LPW11_16405 [Geomonas sp. RF6]|uniref:hypothetical protein n=1 Tax=Geomonas sp. RF6 TaxID=2897342 RepID=UPI001E4F616E|nr:hypothetical protein [Geomonas sp. RF6]UFS69469.1 hypothetical protein LPW11_16405 [Geomonas sp. RF6]